MRDMRKETAKAAGLHPDFRRLLNAAATSEQMLADQLAAGDDLSLADQGVIDENTLYSFSVARINASVVSISPEELASDLLSVLSGAWTDGFICGVLFQRAGGHIDE